MLISRKYFNYYAWALMVMLGAYCVPVFSAKHALLVGVSDYQFKPLQGPEFDVIAMKRALRDSMGFKEQNITLLLNERATKQAILESLENLIPSTRQGDEVFIYFSGHGTSSLDQDLNYPLPTTSGAFLPYDVISRTKDNTLQTNLVVGRTDLKPRLKQLDEGGRKVFVVIDACYSGNTVRGAKQSKALPTRHLDLKQELATRGIDMAWLGVAAEQPQNVNSKPEPYPYNNIYYLAAAGEHEVALEISSDRIADYPTIDGKPHGAFTDTLLRLFQSPANADKNNNGQVSYAELKSALRKLMSARKFNHTPLGLPTLTDDKNNLNNAKVLLWSRSLASDSSTQNGKSGKDGPSKKSDDSAKPQQAEAASKVSVKKTSNTKPLKAKNSTRIFIDPSINAEQFDLLKKVNLPKNIVITSNRSSAEFILIKEGEYFLWLSASGDIIKQTKQVNNNSLSDMLAYLDWSEQLIKHSQLGKVGVNIDLIGEGKGSSARKGEDIGFVINAPQGGYMMLANLDSSGYITVLYPNKTSEIRKLGNNSKLSLPRFAKVGEPFGQDRLMAFVFQKDMPVKKFANKAFAYNTASAKQFLNLLSANNKTFGADVLTLTTTP